MCRWDREGMDMAKKLGGMPIEQYFTNEIHGRLPVNEAITGHCLRCKRELSHQEMYPQGRAPRYMCQECYNELAYNSRKDLCLWCGCRLPDHQAIAWQNNPRELKNAFCSGNGLCLEYQKVLAGKVFGLNYNTLRALPAPANSHPGQSNALPAPEYSNQFQIPATVPNQLPFYGQQDIQANYPIQHFVRSPDQNRDDYSQISDRIIKKLGFLQ